ncbi:phosphopentomutase [uncultured Cetobacterium sp.]|uniref:phosphopentomutase n=1 Tax=uncultured Cetobacterium sp. TaxID=527638 RepID=UPI0026259A9B|nr:phosphopentomutase [uncultured Cetobacterium sp.]
MEKIERVTLIVLDSVGVGALPDAKEFGDAGTNTIGNIALTTGGLNLPNMEKMGLGNITDILGVDKEENAIGAYGKAEEKSKGKDTTTGHWEIAGVVQEKAFPTYPNGFPKEVIERFEKETGRKVLCNLPYSGTEVLDVYGEEQLESGAWIVYTSADPVFQIAANEEEVSLKELYLACEKALEICSEMAPVARVIARPYLGRKKGEFKRTSNRHDYSVKPPKETMLDRIKNSGLDVIAVGKTSDIFAGVGITESRGTNKDNLDGILKTIEEVKKDSKGIIFTNLVDFDMMYGHRRDPKGYKNALEEFDSYLPEIMENLKENEVLILTADHGCDPTYKGSDHTREYVPVLVYGKNLKENVNLGTKVGFSTMAATIEDLLLGKTNISGSFIEELKK